MCNDETLTLSWISSPQYGPRLSKGPRAISLGRAPFAMDVPYVVGAATTRHVVAFVVGSNDSDDISKVNERCELESRTNCCQHYSRRCSKIAFIEFRIWPWSFSASRVGEGRFDPPLNVPELIIVRSIIKNWHDFENHYIG